MQEPRGEWSHGVAPAGGGGGGRGAGTAEPVTLVDLDGAVTRIAPGGTWTREQVRHPGDEPLFITRLERGQLWHRSGQRGRTWAHEVQVGPATVVSEGGQFHVVAEADGGATITCLEGQVAVATHLTAALLLQRDEAVSIAADGETCVFVEPPRRDVTDPRSSTRAAWPTTTRDAGRTGPAGLWNSVASRSLLVPALLALVAVLLVVLIIVLVFRGSGASAAAAATLVRLAGFVRSSTA